MKSVCLWTVSCIFYKLQEKVTGSRGMNTHIQYTHCLWHMLHFSAHSFKIICHSAFPSPFLSLVFCWLFNRKQRQQPLGRRWKTTTLLCTQLSTNVLFISSLPVKRLNSRFVVVLLMSACYYSPLLAQSKCQSKSTNFYLLCSAAAKNDLCFPSSTIGFEPKSLTLSSQDITKSQQLEGNQFDHGKQCGSRLDSHWLSTLGREDPYQWQEPLAGAGK